MYFSQINTLIKNNSFQVLKYVFDNEEDALEQHEINTGWWGDYSL